MAHTPLKDAVRDATYSKLGEFEDALLALASRLETDRAELLACLMRGADLCDRGHGQEWAIEARAAIKKATDK